MHSNMMKVHAAKVHSYAYDDVIDVAIVMILTSPLCLLCIGWLRNVFCSGCPYLLLVYCFKNICHALVVYVSVRMLFAIIV